MNTIKMFEIAYRESNNYYKNIIKKDVAIRNMVNGGWNKSSAKMTIPIFKSLMKGKIYKRNMPKRQVDIFLNNILIDYGTEGLKRALNSVRENIFYYESKGVNKKAIKEMYEKYYKILELNK